MISIHTALAGCDVPVRACSPSILTFQSTQPSQAVTKKGWVPVRELTISIHTALAGCDDAVERLTHLPGISIHTALAGCDVREFRLPLAYIDFNPHSPRRL